MDSTVGVVLTFPFVTEESQSHAYCVRKKPIEGRRNYSRSVTRYANESAKKKKTSFVLRSFVTHAYYWAALARLASRADVARDLFVEQLGCKAL